MAGDPYSPRHGEHDQNSNDPHNHRPHRFRRWANEPPPEPAEAIAAVLHLLGGIAIKRAKVPRPLHLDLLTFDEVVRYFVEDRPPAPEVHHGALLTGKGLSRGIPCFQLFVDRHDHPCLTPSGAPYGRFMVAQRMDDELRSLLAGRELVIFT
ncbi:hypothetical protein AB9Q10_45340 [Streptomyces krungchingensis]|uniref:hypothetical protein n=1 Tax=Streptomyces krungchingensis TaxID=1565034 RepID=UPI003CEC88DB